MINNDEHQSPDLSVEIGELTRQKVVRQLHDGLTQTVSALAMRINYARRLITSDPAAAGEELEKVENLTRAATKEIRHIIFLMRPANQESAGLHSELLLLAEKMGELFDLDLELVVDETLAAHLPEEIQAVVFGIVEELIDSVRKLEIIGHLLLRLSQAKNDIAQLNLEYQADGASQEISFQDMDLNDIQAYASLIDGSVIVSSDGSLVQILFPLHLTEPAGDPPR